MLNSKHILILFFTSLFPFSSVASSLFDEAINRNINETCLNYLNEIETSFNLKGINITYAHPVNPSQMPSLHLSSQKFNNGSSSFATTLSPYGENCFLSTVMVTVINDRTCEGLTQEKTKLDNTLQVSKFAENSFILITPIDNSYQLLLTSFDKNGCSITESRMMWPGR